MNLRASYGFGKKEGFYFEPVFSMSNDAWSNDLKLHGYLGARMVSRNWWGLGFTMGNLVSVSAFVNFFDRVELIVGLYGGEHEVFKPMDYNNYLIGQDMEFIAQLRVKL